jgi:holin-like protein
MYLVTITESLVSGPEGRKRAEEYRAWKKKSIAQMQEESGNRAEYREVMSNSLLQEMTFTKQSLPAACGDSEAPARCGGFLRGATRVVGLPASRNSHDAARAGQNDRWPDSDKGADMLAFLTLIFGCQLIGELIAVATGWPIPGPVIGMALLFIGLLVRGGIAEGLGSVGDGLISNLSLLFVPAGVGVMQHAKLIGSELVPISVALVVSTVLAVAVTGVFMAWLGAGGKAADTGPGRQG